MRGFFGYLASFPEGSKKAASWGSPLFWGMGMGGLFVDEFEVVEVEDGAGAAHEVVAADG